MNWARIEELLAHCTKRRPLDQGPISLGLNDYGEFLLRYDGAEGFLSDNQYVALWSAHQVRELNEAYSVEEFAPGITLIGTNGGDTGFGIDNSTGRYLSVPLVGLSRDAASDEGPSLEKFLEGRAAL